MNFLDLGMFEPLLWPLIIFVLLVVVLVLGVSLFFARPERDFSNYIKRKYLFDNADELKLFKLLLELFGDKYYVFPQVYYGHIVEVRKNLSYRERMRYWNSINRKSADFVLCDKEQVVPQLVIELDGSSHEWERRKERDKFVDKLMEVTGLPILHLKTGNFDREFIKGEIGRALASK